MCKTILIKVLIQRIQAAMSARINGKTGETNNPSISTLLKNQQYTFKKSTVTTLIPVDPQK